MLIEPDSEDSKAETSINRTQKPCISCDKCGKKFFVTDTTYKRTPKERLSLHIITEHNRERLYQCPYDGCFKAYNTVKLLQQHKTVGTFRNMNAAPRIELKLGDRIFRMQLGVCRTPPNSPFAF